MAWSAEQYVKYEDERTRPVRDLIAAIPNQAARTVVDLGCGPANSTALLTARFPGAATTGVDSSPEMINAARRRMPATEFAVADIAGWSRSAGTVDVILSNAALHWLSHHETLMPALLAKLNPGGSLAVQMPDNLYEPAHRHMREVGALPRWADRLAGAARPLDGQHTPGWYYDLLSPGSARVDVWRTTYHHRMAGAVGIVEWFKGSALIPFLAPLDDAERQDFLDAYLEAITPDYPPQTDGSVLLPFPRLFFVATGR